MGLVIKKVFWVFLFVLISCKAIAQKFTTHAVKRGETLESIAKEYKVSTDDILTYNKEVKKNMSLKASTILVIPLDAKNTTTIVKSGSSKTEVENTPIQEEPTGFTSYKVKKKETLYSIARRFHITEDDIKKYNPELYASTLRKKMVLRIPKYRRVKPEETQVIEEEYDNYTVTAKETRWSIAHKYGITIDNLLELNPSLSADANSLSEGTVLKLPKLAGSSVSPQEVQLYKSYTVPAGQTFYSLEKKFGHTADELIALNPEIKERGGLKEGMILRIPEKKAATGVVNVENYIFYEVKPKQTEYSLTRKLGLSYKELLQLNPEIKEGLKAGMVLKLPKTQTGDFEVRNSLALDKINLLDSISVGSKSSIMFLLPFRLDKLDLSNREEVAKKINSRKDLKYSLGLYSGALIALDSIKKLGISVDVKTLDNQLDAQKTKEVLSRENIGAYDAIVGPLDGASLKEVAMEASRNNIPVLAPVPVKNKLPFSNVFYSYPSESILRERMLAYIEEQVTDQNIIIIADEKNIKVEELIQKRFPNAKVMEVTEEKKNVSVNLDKLTALFSDEVENWVFLETNNFKIISSVCSILNSSNTEDRVVRMFTTNKNNAFDNDVISSSHLSKLKFTYPSAYREVSKNSFVKRYEKRFGETPDRYAVRGFDLTYDLLLKLAYKNSLIEASNSIGHTEYNGNGFNYVKERMSGYQNNAAYIMSLDDMRVKQIK
ncbi:LysM peptidoglycan-binding domain-containing protein [uncultured Maribacter sp.]|uniref:LysM peptidoglycan-binding domain-containing protein n=1 Tax=uncultured Maribacter sp. TaxID=431308 RepID=UPI002608DFFC|nr:LysM peptidoglycan-binding domain-containing protein [uncultured Maribacter sp.]